MPTAPDRADPLPGKPLATVAKIKGAHKIAALDLRAARLGLKVGISLADARAMVPELDVHDADPTADADTLRALADWCRLFTPLAALDGPDGAILDISGATHLFGGEAPLRDTITHRLEAQGFSVRVAIAGSPGAAWALARYGGARAIIPNETSPADCAKHFAPMPLAALRLDERAIAQLGQAGLRRIGDLLLRPRAPITARYGPGICLRLDDLFGRHRPISPRFEAPAFMAERRFAEGIAHRDGIEAAILALCEDLCGLLARHGEGARTLDISLFRVDGAVKHIGAGTSRPLRDPKTMARLFHERIEAIGEDGLDTGYGFDVIRLAALSAERLDPSQPSWDEGGAAGADLASLIDRLGARFGLDRVTQLVPQDTHRPERAAAALKITSSFPHRTIGAHPEGVEKIAIKRFPYSKQNEGTSNLSLALHQEPLSQDLMPKELLPKDPPALPERPLRLLGRPEPIETLAGVPDEPPVRFRWRAVMHHVAAIEGPERIGPEWWKQPGATRDYFRVEDTAGQRFWLFREGLYQDRPEPRWFMHGLFA